MKRLNTSAQRKPIGGHHFTDRGQIIKADTFSELVDAVAEYRLANSWPLGEPEDEVLAYYETIAPWLVVDDGTPPRPRGIPAHVRALRDWLNAVKLAGNVSLCSKKEAAERAEGCKGCKYASDLDWAYSDETEEMERRAALLRGMRQSDVNDTYCRLHKWEVGVAVNLARPSAPAGAAERSPERCFVRKMLIK